MSIYENSNRTDLNHPSLRYVQIDSKTVIPPMCSFYLSNTCEYDENPTETVLFQPLPLLSG